MSRRFLIGLALLCALLPLASASAAGPERRTIGESVRDRPIVTWHQGDPKADFRVLVVGSVHGDERQGMRVIARIRQALAGRKGPKGIGFWTVKTANPDGTAAGTRKNARDVDLNRNFPFRWDGGLTGGYYPGPRPASEPETRALMRLTRRKGFDLAIWFHQPWGRTLAPCNEDRHWAFLYARLSGLGTGGGCDRGHYPGSATSWQHHTAGTTAFVVELAAGKRPSAEIRRHAAAVIRLAQRMR